MTRPSFALLILGSLASCSQTSSIPNFPDSAAPANPLLGGDGTSINGLQAEWNLRSTVVQDGHLYAINILSGAGRYTAEIYDQNSVGGEQSAITILVSQEITATGIRYVGNKFVADIEDNILGPQAAHNSLAVVTLPEFNFNQNMQATHVAPAAPPPIPSDPNQQHYSSRAIRAFSTYDLSGNSASQTPVTASASYVSRTELFNSQSVVSATINLAHILIQNGDWLLFGPTLTYSDYAPTDFDGSEKSLLVRSYISFSQLRATPSCSVRIILDEDWTNELAHLNFTTLSKTTEFVENSAVLNRTVSGAHHFYYSVEGCGKGLGKLKDFNFN